MLKVEQKYVELVNTPSDINEHLIVLRYYADHCTQVDTPFLTPSSVT